jgi:hypothetical protein
MEERQRSLGYVDVDCGVVLKEGCWLLSSTGRSVRIEILFRSVFFNRLHSEVKHPASIEKGYVQCRQLRMRF